MEFSGLRPETEITLLLCARFGKDETQEHPLTLGEFNQLQRMLRKFMIPFPYLLNQGALDDLADDPEGEVLVRERIGPLLDRGTTLAAEVERWDSRGIWVMDRTASDYPQRWLERLGDSAPPLLFGAGDASLLNEIRHPIAVIGARDADQPATRFTEQLCSQSAYLGHAIVSGGARGIDAIALANAIKVGGSGVSILPGNLERVSSQQTFREAIVDDQLVAASPYHPRAGFTVGNAMGRNRLIYCLADIAVVVSASEGSGGTWAGATEALRRGWLPVFVRQSDDMPEGNRALLEHGARPLPEKLVDDAPAFEAWLDEEISRAGTDPGPAATRQLGLFDPST